MAIRYTIPLFTPSAWLLSASLSNAALHMAHWASKETEAIKKKKTSNSSPLRLDKDVETLPTDRREKLNFSFLMNIVRGNHEIDHHTSHGNI